jgi:hypothetical protein
MTISADDLDAARMTSASLARILSLATERLAGFAPGLAPHDAWSAGSVVAQMRHNARITPAREVMHEVPVDLMAMIAAAFQPSICLATLVGIVAPMVLLDLRRTFPKCWSACGLTKLLIANSIVFEDVTHELRALLRKPDLLDRLLDPEIVRRFGATIVAIRTSTGAWFPSDVDWGEGHTRRTLAPLRYWGDVDLPHFWQIAALAALKDADFEVTRALRPIGQGIQPGLCEYRMPDGVMVDLRKFELGDAWVDYRDRAQTTFSKLGGNSDCFGVPARSDERPGTSTRPGTAYGPDGRPHEFPDLEQPAPHTSLLLAGAVAAQCLATVGVMIELAERAQSCVAHVATDSTLLLASEHGGLLVAPDGPLRTDDGQPAIRLLSFDDVRGMAARFDELLGHRGAPAWSVEAGSMSAPTLGLCLGANKVVMVQ